MDIAESCFKHLALMEGVTVDKDFLYKALEAMRRLTEHDLRNSVYNLVSALASGKLELDRMPFPLIEANVAFFAGSPANVRPEYRSWLETMYVHFGQKFVNLFCGPHFKWTEGCQGEEDGKKEGESSEKEEEKDGEHKEQGESSEKEEEEIINFKPESGRCSTPIKRTVLWKGPATSEEGFLKECGEAVPQMGDQLSKQLAQVKNQEARKQNPTKRLPDNVRFLHLHRVTVFCC